MRDGVYFDFFSSSPTLTLFVEQYSSSISFSSYTTSSFYYYFCTFFDIAIPIFQIMCSSSPVKSKSGELSYTKTSSKFAEYDLSGVLSPELVVDYLKGPSSNLECINTS